MSLQVTKKKKFASEKETKTRILTVAQLIGCFQEAKRIFDKYETNGKKETNAETLEIMATELIKDLAKLDVRLIGWLINEQGEIIVGNKTIIKMDPNIRNMRL